MTPEDDLWVDLMERFEARGVRLRQGNVIQDMVRHLLDIVEEQDQRIRGLESAHKALTRVRDFE